MGTTARSKEDSKTNYASEDSSGLGSHLGRILPTTGLITPFIRSTESHTELYQTNRQKWLLPAIIFSTHYKWLELSPGTHHQHQRHTNLQVCSDKLHLSVYCIKQPTRITSFHAHTHPSRLASIRKHWEYFPDPDPRFYSYLWPRSHDVGAREQWLHCHSGSHNAVAVKWKK